MNRNDDKNERNRRSDSVTAAVTAAQNAQLDPHDPPAHMDFPDSARPYWDFIMQARARDRWLPLDLSNAAELAMIYDDMARMRAKLRLDGDLDANGKAHPLHRVLSDAQRRVIALSRMLHVHPEATEGRSRDSGNALQNERKANDSSSNLPANIARLIPRSSA